MVDQVAEEVRAEYSDLAMEACVPFGGSSNQLVDASGSAELVAGSRGYGGFRGLLMGSVF